MRHHHRIPRPHHLAAALALLGASPLALAAPYACGGDIRVFNTGVSNALTPIASAAVVNNGSAASPASEPRWQVASMQVENVTDLQPIAAWSTPVVAHLTGVWKWATPTGAAWISPNNRLEVTKYTYYKLSVDLASTVDAATFAVNANMHADDQVMAVFLNGVKVNATALNNTWNGSNISVPDTLAIRGNWRVGANELIVQVRNNGWSLSTPLQWGGFALEATSTACTTVIPSTPVVAAVPADNPIALLAGGLLVAGAGAGAAARRSKKTRQ